MRAWYRTPAGVAAQKRRTDSGKYAVAHNKYVNSEKGRATCAKANARWRAANPDRVKAWKKRSYDRNRVVMLTRKRERYARERDIRNVKRRAYYACHRERFLAAWRADYIANPAKYKHKAKLMKAKRKGAVGTFTQADVDSIYQNQNGRCLYCGVDLHGAYHIEHRIPIIRGGTNWPGNIACSCATCNMQKGRMTDAEFVIRMKQKTEATLKQPSGPGLVPVSGQAARGDQDHGG